MSSLQLVDYRVYRVVLLRYDLIEEVPNVLSKRTVAYIDRDGSVVATALVSIVTAVGS
jgi:hypothetical protein